MPSDHSPFNSSNHPERIGPQECQEILMNAPICIFRTSPKGLFLSANHATAQKLGYASPGELMRSVTDIGSQLYADPGVRDELLRLLAEQDKVENFECRLLRRDGSDLWVSLNIQAIRDQEGDLSHFQVFALDITERKHAEEALRESEARNSVILNAVPDLMFVNDRQGVYLEYYGMDETLLAAQPDELLGRSVHEILPRELADDCLRALEGAHQTGKTQILEYTLEVRRGPKSFEARITPIDDQRLLTIVRDVTEQKRAKEELRRKNEEQALLLESVPTQLWFLTDEKTYGAVNQAHADFLGQSKRRMEYRGLEEFLPPDEAKICKQGNIEVFESKRVIHTEEWLHNAQGEPRLISITKTPKLNGNNQVEYVVCCGSDITERKQAEDALQQSENYYRAIFETSGSPMLIIEEDNTISLVNSNFEEQTGYSREEVEGKTFWTEFVHPEDVGWMREYHSLRRQEPGSAPHHYEFRFLGRNSEVRYAYLTIDLIPGTTQSVVSFIDITERKELEERLRTNESFLNGILESIQDGISVLDSSLTIRQVNRVMRKRYAANEPLEGQKCYQAYHGRSVPCSPCPTQRCLRSGRLEYDEIPGSPVSSMQWLELFSYPMQEDSQGKVSYVVEFVRDITQRKQAEQALLESERKYRQEKEYLDNLFQNSADAVVILDEHGRIVRWNKQAHKASGYSFQEVRGMHFSRFHADEKQMEQMLSELRKWGSIQDYEITFLTKNGQAIPCSISISTIHDRENKLLGSINIVRDLTEWKKTQQKLEEMSLHDALTGLYSRSFFEEEMRRLADDRYCPIGLLVCDINGLKLINDTMGHDQGDELIRATARILKQCFRASDIIARIGGDEFAVLLPESSLSIVQTCCERIRHKVRHFNKLDPRFGLSLSMGYAVEEKPPADMNTLFKKADDNMYKEKLRESYSSRSETVQALIKTLEERDHITEGHAERLSDFAQQLGRSLKLSESRLQDVRLLAWFHDLGKVGVPDRILYKPLPLTKDEFEEIKRHCEIGHRIALSTSDLAPIADLILKHHEWWDGRGYPLGLAGEAIPLECRILAIVDAYDAMTSHRPYRKALSREDAIQELRRCAGTQFDPELVEIFIWILQE